MFVFWRDHTVLLDAESDLPEALAHAFTRLASKATEPGLVQGYQTVDEALPVLRGRIRVRDQIARRYGIGLPLEVTYDDFTVDIAENQINMDAEEGGAGENGAEPAKPRRAKARA